MWSFVDKALRPPIEVVVHCSIESPQVGQDQSGQRFTSLKMWLAKNKNKCPATPLMD